MTVKTDYSRFHIHDELTAPEKSTPIVKLAQVGPGGSVNKFIGVLAGAPSALRAYTLMRHELRNGSLPRDTRERIALAVAELRGDPYSVSQHVRTARSTDIGIDEVNAARRFNSADPKEAALLRFLKALVVGGGRPSEHLAEEAREAGWTDEQLLDAVAHVALCEFQSLIANAAALPADQSEPVSLAAAA